MKILIPFLMLLCLCGCTANQKNIDKAPERILSGNKNPGFEFIEEIHNFGTRKSGEILTFIFIYRNPGPGRLELGKTESGCVCLKIHPDKKIVEPGDTGRINVTFNTSGLFGLQFQSFRISNLTGTVWKDLAVTADIRNGNIQFL